jgi:hypothetical protein
MKNIVEDMIAGKANTKDLKKQMDKDPALKKKLTRQFQQALNKRGERIKRLEKEVSIKLQLAEVSSILSMAYIAKTYFGKTRHWLYQRINGNVVNGKESKFTNKELNTLQFALKDISKKIGSVTVL